MEVATRCTGAVDRTGRLGIDVLVGMATGRATRQSIFLRRAGPLVQVRADDVVTAAAQPICVLDELMIPAALHSRPIPNHRIEAESQQVETRLRPTLVTQNPHRCGTLDRLTDVTYEISPLHRRDCMRLTPFRCNGCNPRLRGANALRAVAVHADWPPAARAAGQWKSSLRSTVQRGSHAGELMLVRCHCHRRLLATGSASQKTMRVRSPAR